MVDKNIGEQWFMLVMVNVGESLLNLDIVSKIMGTQPIIYESWMGRYSNCYLTVCELEHGPFIDDL